MFLPYLPDEMETKLDGEGYRGAVAFWRPMDLLDKSRWADECRHAGVSTASAEGRFLCIRRQLLRITGLLVQEKKPESEGGELFERDFDVTKDIRRVPLALLLPIFDDIELRSTLSEGLEKNSEEPSASVAPSGSAL